MQNPPKLKTKPTEKTNWEKNRMGNNELQSKEHQSNQNLETSSG